MLVERTERQATLDDVALPFAVADSRGKAGPFEFGCFGEKELDRGRVELHEAQLQRPRKPERIEASHIHVLTAEERVAVVDVAGEPHRDPHETGVVHRASRRPSRLRDRATIRTAAAPPSGSGLAFSRGNASSAACRSSSRGGTATRPVRSGVTGSPRWK